MSKCLYQTLSHLSDALLQLLGRVIHNICHPLVHYICKLRLFNAVLLIDLKFLEGKKLSFDITYELNYCATVKIYSFYLLGTGCSSEFESFVYFGGFLFVVVVVLFLF